VAAQLWLLRHGEAEPHDARPDPERRLTARGEDQSRAAGLALASVDITFARVFTSPLVRALDTARLACDALGVEPEIRDVLAGRFDAGAAADLIAEAGPEARILVVGHEPDFSQTVEQLTGATIDMKKGGIAAVRISDPEPELIVLLRPREIDPIAASHDGAERTSAPVADGGAR
jgi:phosphohistidine phosphatase